MRILLLCHTFNSLSQRLYTELSADGHLLSVELDINDRTTEEAVALFKPDLVLAPFLKRAIPAQVYESVKTLIVHPGIRGDRGPSALDHALLRGEKVWGVTIIEASPVFDAGYVWAWEEFTMPLARKSSIYRNAVTEGAVRCVRQAIANLADPRFQPQRNLLEDGKTNPAFKGSWHPVCRQEDRRIDWKTDTTEVVIRKIHSGDGFPGTLDDVLGRPLYLFNARPDSGRHRDIHAAASAAPGTIIAVCDEAICLKTIDGAVWVSHLREKKDRGLKLPAARVVPDLLTDVPVLPVDIFDAESTVGEIRCEMVFVAADNVESNDTVGAKGMVGSRATGPGGEWIALLHFDFYNGAMNTEQCRRLMEAVRQAKRRARVLILMGSEDYFSNGIHLNTIEAADSPADESLRNIEAMNDLCKEIIEATDCITISAMQGNAGAGGVFFALAADYVYARQGVVLNPHYRSMGNLYGSEYWTYLLHRRMSVEDGAAIMHDRLPISAEQAVRLRLIDDCFGSDHTRFREEVLHRATQIIKGMYSGRGFTGESALFDGAGLQGMLDKKRLRRQADEAVKPLQSYRDEEIERMKMNFYGFDPSYHIARYNFVHRVPVARTPLYLARHRRALSEQG